MSILDEKALVREIKADGKGVGIPAGAAKVFAEKAVKDAMLALADKSVLTDKSIKSAVSKELRKYSTDLAYVYKNRDTII